MNQISIRLNIFNLYVNFIINSIEILFIYMQDCKVQRNRKKKQIEEYEQGTIVNRDNVRELVRR